MAHVRELIRELRPHAIWWLLEATVIAALTGLGQYLRSHLDLVLILVVFVGSLSVLVLGSLRKLRSTRVQPPATEIVAPQLLIRYTSKEHGKITFINDGPGSIVDLELGPLTWEESRTMGVIGSVDVLLPQTTCEKVMMFESAPNQGYELYHYMRESTPHDARHRVTVTYEDSKGTRFAKDFLLTSEIDGTITWKPGVLRYASTSPIVQA